MKGYWIGLCLAVLPVVALAEAPTVRRDSTAILANGQTIVKAHSAMWSVKVIFKTHTVNIGKPSDALPSHRIWPCTYSRYPCSPVDHLTISVNGKALYVPPIVLFGLADVNTAELRLTAKAVTLVLTGGDASEAYITRITFDRRHVRRVTWAPGEASDQILQETIFHYLPANYFNH